MREWSCASGVSCVAGFDASGGRTDRAALAIAHSTGDGAAVLDVVRAWAVVQWDETDGRPTSRRSPCSSAPLAARETAKWVKAHSGRALEATLPPAGVPTLLAFAS